MEVEESVVLPLGDEPSARNGRNAAENAKWVPLLLVLEGILFGVNAKV